MEELVVLVLPRANIFFFLSLPPPPEKESDTSPRSSVTVQSCLCSLAGGCPGLPYCWPGNAAPAL